MSGLTPQEAADLLGVSTRTLLRWEEKGKITPRRTEGGHRRYDIYELLGNKTDATLTVGYARVSSHDQKQDLERQSRLLEAYCAKQGWSFEEDLAQDVLEIITVFSARLYGSRSHRNKQIVEQLREVAKELK